MLYFPLKYHQ